MDIREKLMMDRPGLEKYGPINIVAFGDSVTHGALYLENNFETVYWNRLRQKINAVRDYMPVNVINAGIGGTTAKESVARIDSQVLSHNPDLVIVCFGLNDVNGTLDDYLSSLEIIFDRLKASGTEVVFLTPNMLNTYVDKEGTPPQYIDYAAVTAQYQNEGRMDMYIYSAIDLARKMQVEVCDCYSKWKKLSETEDTTKMLINRINHPTQEMHELFAQSLFELLFGDDAKIKAENDSTMYSK